MGYNRTLKHFTNSQELATVWASGQIYIVNQLVLNNNMIYRCITANTSGATFAGDSAYWVGVDPGATITIAQGGTGQTTQTTAFNALSPTTTAGDMIANDGTNNVRVPIGLDGQTLVVDSTQPSKVKWASSAQGNKNYFSLSNINPLFETGAVTPWSAATLTFSSGAPSGTPTLSATQMSIAVSNTNPLMGSYSMRLSHAAANAQYQGFISGAFTIDREDLAKVLYGSFSYEVISGTVDFSGSSTQSLEIWVYNVNANQWIQPAGFRGMNQSFGSGLVSFSFQSDANSANNQYKIAVITQQTATSSYVVAFDDFKVGPSAVSVVQLRNPAGTIISTGSLTPPSGYLYCNGSAISRTGYAELFAAIGTTYGTGDGSTTFNLPDLRGIFARGAGTNGTMTNANGAAYSATLGGTQNDQSQGHRHASGAGFAFIAHVNSGGGAGLSAGSVLTDSSTTNDPTTDGTNGTPRTGAETRPANVGVAYHICYSSGNVQMSSDTDTRVVSASYKETGSQSGSSFYATFGTKLLDTHGAFSSDTFTAPVSGNYSISTYIKINSESGTANVATVEAYVNGVSKLIFSSSPNLSTVVFTPLSGTTILPLNAGDTLKLWVTNSGGVSMTVVDRSIAIQRISGPSVIAPVETVAARYYTTSGQTISTSGTIVNFETKDIDTHNAVTTGIGTWKFTAPISGKYLVGGTIQIQSANYHNAYLDKNGSDIVILGENSAMQVVNFTGAFVQLNAGDYLQIRANVSTASATLATSSQTNYVNIIKVGN